MYFDFHDDPIVIPQEKYDAVLDWAFERLGSESKPSLTIQKSNVGHGHGLYATQAILANTVAFTIPNEKCFTLQAAKSQPAIGNSLAIMEEDLGKSSAVGKNMTLFTWTVSTL